jgi:hypothetical protein
VTFPLPVLRFDFKPEPETAPVYAVIAVLLAVIAPVLILTDFPKVLFHAIDSTVPLHDSHFKLHRRIRRLRINGITKFDGGVSPVQLNYDADIPVLCLCYIACYLPFFNYETSGSRNGFPFIKASQSQATA